MTKGKFIHHNVAEIKFKSPILRFFASLFPTLTSRSLLSPGFPFNRKILVKSRWNIRRGLKNFAFYDKSLHFLSMNGTLVWLNSWRGSKDEKFCSELPQNEMRKVEWRASRKYLSANDDGKRKKFASSAKCSSQAWNFLRRNELLSELSHCQTFLQTSGHRVNLVSILPKLSSSMLG